MNRSILKQVYADFLSLPFPEGNGEEKLTDWIAELADLEGYYAGLAETLIMNQPVQVENLPSLHPLFTDLKKLRNQLDISENKYFEYEHYLLSLEKLVKEIESSLKI